MSRPQFWCWICISQGGLSLFASCVYDKIYFIFWYNTYMELNKPEVRWCEKYFGTILLILLSNKVWIKSHVWDQDGG